MRNRRHNSKSNNNNTNPVPKKNWPLTIVTGEENEQSNDMKTSLQQQQQQEQEPSEIVVLTSHYAVHATAKPSNMKILRSSITSHKREQQLQLISSNNINIYSSNVNNNVVRYPITFINNNNTTNNSNNNSNSNDKDSNHPNNHLNKGSNAYRVLERSTCDSGIYNENDNIDYQADTTTSAVAAAAASNSIPIPQQMQSHPYQSLVGTVSNLEVLKMRLNYDKIYTSK